MELKITVTVAFIGPYFQLDIWPHNSPNFGSFGHSPPPRIHPPFWTCLVWSWLNAQNDRIQNAAARLVTGTPRFCHVTPLLFHLHWLPISYRIKFKILLLTFKCLYGLAPNYLIGLISIKKQSRYSLRSNESLLLELPSTKTRPTLGDRAFQSAAPYLWNALPSTIRNMKTWDTFKTAVKTHFFNLAFK